MKIVSDNKTIDNHNRTPITLVKEKLEALDFSQRTRGSIFEKLCQTILQEYDISNEFEKIDLWGDWQYSTARKTGIDFVITTKFGEYIAVSVLTQHSYSEAKRDIDLFFYFLEKRIATNVGNVDKDLKYSRGIVISFFGAVCLEKHRKTYLENQNCRYRTDVITLLDLVKTRIDWESVDSSKSEIPLLPPKKSSKIQEKIFEETRKYLKKYDKGRITFPDCDDKFLPLLRLIEGEDIVEENRVVLYLAQNTGQLIRVFTSFRRDRTQPFLAHFVYEEKHLFAIDGFSIGFPISMSSRENLKNAYEKAKKLEQKLIVFATYSDLPMDELGEFDFVIYDEAYSAIPEAPKKAIKDEEIKPIFNPFVDNKCFSAKKRLFITPFLPKAQKPLGVSMTQASILEENPNGVFGEIICSFDVDTAQGYGLLTDFRLIVPIAIQEDYIDLKNTILEKIKKDKEDIKETQFDVLRIAKTTSLLNFFRGQNPIDDPNFKHPRNAILFTQKIPTAQRIEHEVEYIQHLLDKNKKKDNANIELCFIPNTCANNYMKRIDIFKKLEKESYNPCNIILDSHFFVEKIDNPPPDCVVLFDSQMPSNEIAQLLFEALQNAKNKEIGYIVVPLVITREAFLDASTLKRNSQFQFVRKIVGLLDSMGVSQSDKNLLGEKIIVIPNFCLPQEQDLDKLERIKNLIVDKVSSKDEFFSWGKFRNKLSDISSDVRNELRAIQKDKRHSLIEELNASMNIVMDDADLYDLLSAHIITKPILDKLYGRFLENDPIRKKIDEWLNDALDYSFVLNKCLPSSLIDDAILEFQDAIKQDENERVLYKIYDAYQYIACKNRKRFIGVVPTPPQVVDFILRMTNDVLKKHLQLSFDDKNVKMYDPFAGRGEFFARMFEKESGFISDSRVEERFQEGMFAQDLTILAYYIAIINISFSAQKRKEKLGVFKNIRFIDSLSFLEKSSEIDTQGSSKSSKEANPSQDTNVIITNPPFLGALPSNNLRMNFNSPFPHPKLEEHIFEIYCKKSKSKSASLKKNPLIQSLITVMDKIQDKGVISIIVNEMIFKGRSTNCLRKTLVENFNHIYLFNFRGSRINNLRGSLREEGGKIFNGGGKTADALLILVKNGDKKKGKIQYYEMEDGLSAIEKNDVISSLRTLEDVKFLKITQDEAGDWLEKRDTLYEKYIPLVSDTTDEQKNVFSFYSTAIKTGRDAWTYNFSQTLLVEKINTIIQRYNQNPEDFPEEELKDIPLPKKLLQLTKEKKQLHQVSQTEVVTAMYRPFVKQFLLWDRVWVDSSSKNPYLFSNKGNAENSVIYISRKDFCVLASKHLADYHLLNETIAFPLYRYENNGEKKYVITDWILQKFQQIYGEEVSKEDIFCYVYGLLHHRQYVKKYQESLKKVLPRIIFAKDFKKFVNLSKQLLDLHLDYEKVQMHSSIEYNGEFNGEEYFNVKKMILSKDKTSIQYNENIIIKNIPKEAYEYEIAGRSVIDWTIRRYQVSTDKQSQIENDPNLYMGNGRYVFEHICKIITLAVETVRLIDTISMEEFNIDLKISERKLKKRGKQSCLERYTKKLKKKHRVG